MNSDGYRFMSADIFIAWMLKLASDSWYPTSASKRGSIAKAEAKVPLNDLMSPKDVTLSGDHNQKHYLRPKS